MFGRLFILSRCEYHINGIHIQLIMLIMPNEIENDSKICVQINKNGHQGKT